MTPNDPPAVDELVYQFLERVEDGAGSPSAVLGALCEEWPSRAGPLRRAVSHLADSGMVNPGQDERTESVGGYRIGRRLGGGGMGVVHLAWRDEAEPPVALKLLRPDQLLEPGIRERFERESEAASRLDHPNIVRVVDRGVLPPVGDGASQRPYVALEWHRGGTLDHVVRANASARTGEETRTGADLLAAFGIDADPLTLPGTLRGAWWEIVVRIAREVARALAHAHARGVVHRDVKPSNVLVTPEGRVLLLDFGLANLRGSGRLTASGVQLGSLPYMSPEQVRGESVSDERTDVYSLAVTTFEILTMRLPFRAEDPERLGLAILSGGAPPLAKLAPDVPPEVVGPLDAVLRCAMDVDPRGRYASAEAFAADLTAILRRGPIVARPPSTWTRTVKWVRRRPYVAATSALATVLLLGAPLGYGVLSSRHSFAMERTVDSALSHLANLVEAVDDGMRKLADGPLYGDPLLFEVRLGSIDHALSILDDAERDSVTYLGIDDPRVQVLADQLERARGQLLGSRGLVHYDLYRVDEAIADHAAEERVFREFVARYPNDAAHRIDLAQAIGNRCRALNRSKRYGEVLDVAAEPIEIYRDLLAKGDERPSIRSALAATLIVQSSAFAHTGRGDEASSAVEESAELLRVNVDSGRMTSGDHRSLAESYLLMTWINGTLQASDRLAVLRLCKESVELALAESPRDVHARAIDAETDILTAVCLAELGQLDEAMDHSERGLETYGEILAESPGYSDIRRLEASARAAHGYIELQSGDVYAGLGALRRTLSDERGVLESSPDDPSARQNVAVVAGNLANQLVLAADLGPRRLEEAEALCTETLSLVEPAEGDEISLQGAIITRFALYTRGIARAQAGDLVGSSADLERMSGSVESDDAQGLRFVADAHNERYLALVRTGADAPAVDEAFESTFDWLERAIDAGYGNANELGTTPALEPLRSDPRFAELLERVRR